jgi:hypothetical protein
MRSKFDERQSPTADILRKKIRGLKGAPLVHAADLEEIVKVTDVLPELRFPIDSAADLFDQLGGGEKEYDIVGVRVDPARMIKYMPAFYFPISSMNNFVEKMAELIRQNRPKVDVPTALKSIKTEIRRVAPKFSYPIASRDGLVKMLGPTARIDFLGTPIDPGQIVSRIPKDYFPIESEKDFDRKMGQLMVTRPLIVND